MRPLRHGVSQEDTARVANGKQQPGLFRRGRNRPRAMHRLCFLRDDVSRLRHYGREVSIMAEKVLMKGNEALAEAAIQAGCHHFFGYPITPQTELAAYMSKRMPKVGGTYLQAESEIAAINMVLGASSAGVRRIKAVIGE